MTREELKQQVIELCAGSGLGLADKVSAVRAALTRVQMNVTPGETKPRRVEGRAPILRPSGKMMGKQKREAKSE